MVRLAPVARASDTLLDVRTWTAPEPPELPGTGHRVVLHDTLSDTRHATGSDSPAGLYVCGITPYDSTHLGHANTYLAFDLLVRAWRDAGREVTYVQNVTDIDDPLLERAAQTGADWQELAAEQVELYRDDMAALRILPPTHFVSAVETMPLVVTAVSRLLEEGHAYRVSLPEHAGGTEPELGDVYASRQADPDFAITISQRGQELLDLFAERGGDPQRPGKDDPLDALLWLRARPGEPEWDGGELGSGRPGWHIECACIAQSYLPIPFEVQGGGSDLIFPHHAWSTSHLRLLSGARAPMMTTSHSGMVGYQGEKMSKSLGNLVLVSGLLAGGADPMALRLVLLAHHYREDWEYTEEQLTEATQQLARWRQAMRLPTAPGAAELREQIRAALADDLDAPRAVAAVDEWVARALGEQSGDDWSTEAPGSAARTIDALLGVAC